MAKARTVLLQGEVRGHSSQQSASLSPHTVAPPQAMHRLHAPGGELAQLPCPT